MFDAGAGMNDGFLPGHYEFRFVSFAKNLATDTLQRVDSIKTTSQLLILSFFLKSTVTIYFTSNSLYCSDFFQNLS